MQVRRRGRRIGEGRNHGKGHTHNRWIGGRGRAGHNHTRRRSEQGIFIPTFCHNLELKPFASCFVCVVEIEGHANLEPSCSTAAATDMVVQTQERTDKKARRILRGTAPQRPSGGLSRAMHDGMPGRNRYTGIRQASGPGRGPGCAELIKTTCRYRQCSDAFVRAPVKRHAAGSSLRSRLPYATSNATPRIRLPPGVTNIYPRP